MKEELIKKAYDIAVERYAAVGVDVEQAMEKLQKVALSLHCWQADDVAGFENQGDTLSGGIQATGNYPGKARNMEEPRADILKETSDSPRQHRRILNAIEGDFQGDRGEGDQIEHKNFNGVRGGAYGPAWEVACK